MTCSHTTTVALRLLAGDTRVGLQGPACPSSGTACPWDTPSLPPAPTAAGPGARGDNSCGGQPFRVPRGPPHSQPPSWPCCREYKPTGGAPRGPQAHAFFPPGPGRADPLLRAERGGAGGLEAGLSRQERAERGGNEEHTGGESKSSPSWAPGGVGGREGRKVIPWAASNRALCFSPCLNRAPTPTTTRRCSRRAASSASRWGPPPSPR